MKTKICIFNDLQKHMTLQILEPDIFETKHISVPQATPVMVEYEIPVGTVPYFKVWATGQAFLSYIDPEVKF